MTRVTKCISIIIVLGLLRILNSHAQEPFDLDEVKVVAPYEPTISDAFKIMLNPAIKDTLDIQLSFNYSIPSRKLVTPFELEPIAPARMRGEPLTRLYRGLVKGGYGNYATPYFEGFYNSLRSNNHQYGVHLKHMSSGGNIPDHGHSAYSDNMAKIYGQRFLGRYTLDADLNYERNVVHYYGFKPEDYESDQVMSDFLDSLANKDIRQKFDQISSSLGFGTSHSDSARAHHKYNLGYHWLTDDYNSSEHHAFLKGFFGREIEADPFGMADRQYFSLDANATFFNSKNQLDTTNTAVASLQPKLWSKFDKFQFYIGVNAAFEIDTTSFFRAYPLVGTEVELIPNRLVAFVNISGGIEKHSMSTLRRINPFMETSSHYQFMNVKSDIGGGVRGAVGEIFGYSLTLQRAVIDNHPFFVNDTSALLNNRFSIIYDDISRFSLRAELMAKFGERFSGRITASLYQYGMTNEKEAWHTPSNVLSAHLKYNIQNKIILTSDVFTRSETYGRMFDESGEAFANIAHPFHVDINFGVEYRYTKLLSVFLNFHNVSNKSIQRWMYYPTQGFNFLGGIAYSF
jgi:hypothetical protein